MQTVEPAHRRSAQRPAALVIALSCLAAAAGCAANGATPSAPPQAPRAPVPEQAFASEELAPSALPAETEPTASVSDSQSPERPRAVGLLEFLGIGRGERVADLGAGSGYSLSLMAEAVGPAGVVYARHDPRTLTALPSDHGRPASPTGSLPANIVVMDTSTDAPFSGPAKALHLVTLLFAYRDFGESESERRRLNDAVFRALLPGGHYIIAEHAAPASAAPAVAPGRIEARVVQSEVEAAGFQLVEAAELLSSTSRAAAPQDAESSQYLLEFRKPR